ncbi:MAG: DNA repair protein RecO, partial [Patescibacteria group bacterium]
MNIEAVVIRKVPVREHDQLAVLYSREAGKMTAAARGSLRMHSKQALALDEGNLIHCELVNGKAGPIMTGAQAVRSYSGAKSSSIRWAAVQFFLQTIDTLVYDAQPDEHLWSCLTGILTQLDETTDDTALTVFRRCQGLLLETLGYGVQHPSAFASAGMNRGAMDEQFEAIAQRRLTALDLFYDVVGR